MKTIAANFTKVREQIINAEQRFQRTPGSVQLLAVSKFQPLSAITELIQCGQRAFGENYLQEAVPKIEALNDNQLDWHFIGAIQSNKTKGIVTHFNWVHAVDRLSVAERLNAQMPVYKPSLNICLQVNIDNEAGKAGVSFEQLAELALAVAKLPRLKLRGLMAIPAVRPEFEEQRVPFRKLRLAFEELCQMGLDLDTLSMGMSADFAAAIAEGATLLRIGTAIFGEREKTLCKM